MPISSPSVKIPIVILNGFLGSGKTTLFRNLLAQARRNDLSVCAIVNDMSELDVDGELIGSTEIVEGNSSIMQSIHDCVLSSKKGIQRLEESLATLLSGQTPELIIIETSGSCHPMPLIRFFESRVRYELKGVLALVDTLMLAHDYDYGQDLIPRMQINLKNQKRNMVNLLVEQIMFCSHLILTKTDRIQEDRINDIAQAIRPINPYVPILAVQYGKLSIDDLLALPEYDYHRVAVLTEELQPVLEAENEGDRPYDMATRVIRDDRPFHPQRLWDVCHQYLDQRIYRSKGFFWLPTRDELSLLWNQAAGSINLEVIGYWRSGIVENENNGLMAFEVEKLKEMLAQETGRFGDRHCHLTVIGDKDQVDRFTDALSSCFLTEDEVDHWQTGGDFTDPWPKNIVRMVG